MPKAWPSGRSMTRVMTIAPQRLRLPALVHVLRRRCLAMTDSGFPCDREELLDFGAMSIARECYPIEGAERKALGVVGTLFSG